MSALYIGCDPGRSGAYAFLQDDEVKHISVYPLLSCGEDIDGVKLLNDVKTLVAKYDFDKLIITCEKVQGDDKFGGYRAVKFGEAYGILKATIRQFIASLEESNIAVEAYHVRPQDWKKHLIPEAMQKQPGATYAKHKARAKKIACEYVLHHYPACDIVSRGKTGRKLNSYDDNKAEAVCLAVYGQLKHLGRI